MTTIVPAAKPEIGRHAAEEILHAAGIDIAQPAILARRGYYRDTMGIAGKNDRGIYDDAIIVVSPTAFATFNANTDPSRSHPGVAVLESGLWHFKLGTHNRTKAKELQYPALIQAETFVVKRDGTEQFAKGAKHDVYGECLGDGRWRGWFGMNCHRGGYNTTSSEGCQTLWPEDWDAFYALVRREIQRYQLMSIPYLLTVRPESPT